MVVPIGRINAFVGFTGDSDVHKFGIAPPVDRGADDETESIYPALEYESDPGSGDTVSAGSTTPATAFVIGTTANPAGPSAAGGAPAAPPPPPRPQPRLDPLATPVTAENAADRAAQIEQARRELQQAREKLLEQERLLKADRTGLDAVIEHKKKTRKRLPRDEVGTSLQGAFDQADPQAPAPQPTVARGVESLRREAEAHRGSRRANKPNEPDVGARLYDTPLENLVAATGILNQLNPTGNQGLAGRQAIALVNKALEQQYAMSHSTGKLYSKAPSQSTSSRRKLPGRHTEAPPAPREQEASSNQGRTANDRPVPDARETIIARQAVRAEGRSSYTHLGPKCFGRAICRGKIPFRLQAAARPEGL
jgi:hypothetical protein